MMNSYDDAAGILPLCFGFEYRPGQAVYIHPFPLPSAEAPRYAEAAMVQQFTQLIMNGIRCWGLGLMFERFSFIEKGNTQYQLTITDDGDPSITGIVVDMHGNSYHAVTPRASTDNFWVRFIPTAGHRRTLISDDSIVRVLESNARALPEVWRKRDVDRSKAEPN
ncbi:hypothetical protein [Nocardia sp. BMG51109]|uniref:hypothetical protein n=1 Tax=Nocardia sp. BMG51109 TaxID=1056816 RepID=UPI0004BB0BB8|nr:hypothetical protein [Nocardia sp. BMG51109]